LIGKSWVLDGDGWKYVDGFNPEGFGIDTKRPGVVVQVNENK
jgi:hypothetical protein